MFLYDYLLTCEISHGKDLCFNIPVSTHVGGKSRGFVSSFTTMIEIDLPAFFGVAGSTWAKIIFMISKLLKLFQPIIIQ